MKPFSSLKWTHRHYELRVKVQTCKNYSRHGIFLEESLICEITWPHADYAAAADTFYHAAAVLKKTVACSTVLWGDERFSWWLGEVFLNNEGRWRVVLGCARSSLMRVVTGCKVSSAAKGNPVWCSVLHINTLHCRVCRWAWREYRGNCVLLLPQVLTLS